MLDLRGALAAATERFVVVISELVERDVRDRIRAEVDKLTSTVLAGRRGRPKGSVNRFPSIRKGRKLDMTCRYPGCKNRSKGPRFHFLCDEHLKLGKAAVAKVAAKKKALAESKSA